METKEYRKKIAYMRNLARKKEKLRLERENFPTVSEWFKESQAKLHAEQNLQGTQKA